jgi:uncharacterized protein YjbI with pentapeptide repeats
VRTERAVLLRELPRSAEFQQNATVRVILDSTRDRWPRERPSVRRVACIALLALLANGCGDESDTGGARVPAAGGVHESSLADDPGLRVTLEHTVMLHLEARGTHTGDTDSEEGADAIPYFFDRPTELTLAAEFDGEDTPTLVLFDDAGFELARVGPNRPEETLLVAGAYVIRVHHPRAGENAPPISLFLRPRRGTAPRVRSSGTGNVSDEATVTAGKDCPGCNLRGMTWIYDTITNTNLSLADFTGATMQIVEMNQAILTGTIFDDTTMMLTLFNNVEATRASFKNARFLSGSRIQDIGTDNPGRLDHADFTDATLSDFCLEARNMDGATFAGAVFNAKSDVGSANFAGADLSSTVFDGTDLKHLGTQCGLEEQGVASFSGAILSSAESGVRFLGADLTGIDLNGADLSRAALRGSQIDETTNFAGADFSGTDFAGVDLSRANLSNAILSAATSFVGATLSDGMAHGVNLACLQPEGTGGCHFEQQTTQFKGANLTFANLSGVGLATADLEGAILDDAVLVGANLNLVSLKNAKLRGALLGAEPGSGAPVTQLGGAFMVNVDLTDADLRGVNLTGAHLYGDSLLLRTRLDSADLSRAICAGAAFSGTLTDSVFNEAVLVNATFNGAVLSDVKFDSAYLQGADFSAAKGIAGATLRNAAVSTTPGEWPFMEQDGTPFTFPYGATNLGALATDPSVTCPNDQSGPCTMDKLTPVENGPFPPQPPCAPSEQFCFENCLNPPNFGNKPPC